MPQFCSHALPEKLRPIHRFPRNDQPHLDQDPVKGKITDRIEFPHLKNIVFQKCMAYGPKLAKSIHDV